MYGQADYINEDAVRGLPLKPLCLQTGIDKGGCESH